MNKYIALCALGVVAVDARKHHKKQQHAQKLSNQVLQQEIEELKEEYSMLEHKFEVLSQTVKKQQSLVQSPYGLAGPGGPAYPSPQPFVRGEKQWMDNAQNINDWGDKQVNAANTRIPYQSTVQLEASPNKYGLAGAGGPAYPSPQPFVRGEKQWMDNAQNINNWGDQQMTVANTRIPYFSTVQLESETEAAPNKYGLGGVGGPAKPSPQPFVRGEKQWMDNAQNINNWQDHQMEVANARIPYFSTVQLDSEVDATPNLYGLGGAKGPAMPSPQPFVRGEKQWMDNAQNINDWQDKQMTVANTRIPYWSTLLQTDAESDAAPNLYGLAGAGGPAYPSPQPFVRGEKQWMDNAQNINNWQDQQMTVANTRIPYWSTLVQTGDFSDDYEQGVDMNILYEKNEGIPTTPEKIVTPDAVPLSTNLIQLNQDDDPKNMEGMLMEDPNIPLNLRLVHIETQEGDELIKID